MVRCVQAEAGQSPGHALIKIPACRTWLTFMAPHIYISADLPLICALRCCANIHTNPSHLNLAGVVMS